MNKFLKALSLLAMLSISSFSWAYKWDFDNITDKTLVIKLKLAGTSDNFFNVVGPGEKTSFDWSRPNARAGYCMSDLSIAQYDESKVANFPGTNSKKLPTIAGKKTLDTKKITSAIDARGEWFNSLSKLAMINIPIMQLSDAKSNDFKRKINQATEKIKGGMASSKAMSEVGLNINHIVEDAVSIPALEFIGKLIEKCSSYNFIIIEHNGELKAIGSLGSK